MPLSTIIGAVLAYLVVMFMLHEVIKKFFHFILFLSIIVFGIVLVYLSIKGV